MCTQHAGLIETVLEASIGLVRGQDHDQLEVLLDSLSDVELKGLVASLVTRVAHARQPTQAVLDLSAPSHVCDVAIDAAATVFGTTREAVLSRARAQEVSDARAVAMSAARANGLSLPTIAKHFDKDHASVIHAIRRTAERPRLAAAASSIAEDIASRFKMLADDGPASRRLLEPAAAARYEDTPVDTASDPVAQTLQH